MEPCFIEQLEKNCVSRPDTVALIEAGTGKSVTYAGLWEQSGRSDACGL